jgi:CHASE3 domain sensor protein
VPKQLQLLKEIAATMDRWQREAAGPEFAAKAANRDAAAAVTADHGKELLDGVRKQIGVFENAEYERYGEAKRHAEFDRILKTAGLRCCACLRWRC